MLHGECAVRQWYHTVWNTRLVYHPWFDVFLLGILHAGGLLDFLLLQEEELPTASEHKASFDRCNRMLNQEEAEGKKRVEGLGWVGCGLHVIHRWALG